MALWSFILKSSQLSPSLITSPRCGLSDLYPIIIYHVMCLCCSRPEDRGHQEEAAAVHRAVQVAPKLAESLVRLRPTSVRRPHQPGQRSHRAGINATNMCYTCAKNHTCSSSALHAFS